MFTIIFKMFTLNFYKNKNNDYKDIYFLSYSPYDFTKIIQIFSIIIFCFYFKNLGNLANIYFENRSIRKTNITDQHLEKYNTILQ